MPIFKEPGCVATWTRAHFENTLWFTGDKGRQEAFPSCQPAWLNWSMQSLVTFVVVVGRELDLDGSRIH